MNSNVTITTVCPGPVDTEFNKVAGGTFSVKGITPEYVARVAVKGMFKYKMLVIPTLRFKLAIFFSRFAPKQLLLKIIANHQNKKINKPKK